MKFLSLLLLIIAASCFASAYKRRHKQVVYTTRANTKHITDQNEMSEVRREKYPQGDSRYTEALVFPFWTRIVDVASGEEDHYELRNVKLNQIGTIFTTSEENNIQAVTHSVSLREVAKESDELDQARCCQNISPIREGQAISDEVNAPSSFSCFDVTGNSQVWNFCSEDAVDLKNFRQTLRMEIVANFYQEHSKAAPQFIHDNYNLPLGIAWDYNSQDAWPQTCNGKYQSPIEIDHCEVEEVFNKKLDFKYGASDMTVEYNGHYNEVYGSFGSVNFISEQGEVQYKVEKLVFRFPAEHKVSDNKEDGELQIHHKSADGQEAIVSILLTTEGTGPESAFLAALQPELWNNEDGFTLGLERANLNKLLAKGTINGSMDKSFYHYRGSLSAPPCSEGVEHFVLQQPQYINRNIFNTLQQYTLGPGGCNNSRQPQNFQDVVYFSADSGDNYEPGIPDSIKDLLADRILEQKNALAGPEDKEDPASDKITIDGQIAKVEQNLDHLVYVSGDEQADGEEVDLTSLPKSLKARVRNTGSADGVFEQIKAVSADGEDAPAEGEDAPAEGEDAPAEGEEEEAAPAEGEEEEAAPAEGRHKRMSRRYRK